MSILIRKCIAGSLVVLRPLARRRARADYFAEEMPFQSPRRIALVACHWVGDTFWASQVVPHLLTRWPDSRIHAITKPYTADLWHGLIPAERVLIAPEVTSDRRRERASWSALAGRARELRRLDLDLVIDLTGNRYSAAFAFLLRPRWAVGADGGELGWLYSSNVRDAQRRGEHLSRRPFRVIEPLLGAFAHSEQLRPPRPTEDFGTVCGRLGLDADDRLAVISPGAGWRAKMWAWENFAAVGRELAARGCRVIVLGLEREAELCRKVADGVPGATCAIDQPLGRAAGLLSRACCLIGNDSGVAHIAAAMGRPTAAIFTGETDPAICRPLGPRSAVFDASTGPVSPAVVADEAMRLFTPAQHGENRHEG